MFMYSFPNRVREREREADIKNQSKRIQEEGIMIKTNVKRGKDRRKRGKMFFVVVEATVDDQLKLYREKSEKKSRRRRGGGGGGEEREEREAGAFRCLAQRESSILFLLFLNSCLWVPGQTEFAQFTPSPATTTHSQHNNKK